MVVKKEVRNPAENEIPAFQFVATSLIERLHDIYSLNNAGLLCANSQVEWTGV
jgi:hypothetical protein